MKQVWRPNFPTTPEFWPKVKWVIGKVRSTKNNSHKSDYCKGHDNGK